MNTATIKSEMHKGRLSWIVGGVIRTYDLDSALALVRGEETAPIETTEPRVVVDYTSTARMRCMTQFDVAKHEQRVATMLIMSSGHGLLEDFDL